MHSGLVKAMDGFIQVTLIVFIMTPSQSCFLSARVKQTSEMQAEIDRTWRQNYEILDKLTTPGPFDYDEYRRAVAFFELTTGVPSSASESVVGLVPGPEIPSDLKKWTDWYIENKRFLYIDRATGRIKVDEKAKKKLSE